MSSKAPRVSRPLLAAAAVLLIGGALFAFWPKERPTVSTNGENAARARYAALYEAFWRDERSIGPVAVTATLFAPDMIAALGADAGRSEAESQILDAVEDPQPEEVRLFVTFDSVSGAVPDATIEKNLALLADEHLFVLSSWRPLILPSRVVNAYVPASSQTGVATFRAERPVDWRTLRNVRLTVTGVGGVAERAFAWLDPAAMADLVD